MGQPTRILRAAMSLGTAFGVQVDRMVVEHTNFVLEQAAQRIEAMELYDHYDANTRDMAAIFVRELKLDILPAEDPNRD